MSREIKFRIWSEDQKTYDYKFPYNSIGDFYISTRGKVFSDFGNTVAPEVRQEAFIVEQYTGLKDKNGKEIYEGDIMCFDAIVYEIYWSNEFSGWHNRRVDGGERIYGSNSFEEVTRFGKVIGNIHENPELSELKNDYPNK